MLEDFVSKEGCLEMQMKQSILNIVSIVSEKFPNAEQDYRSH